MKKGKKICLMPNLLEKSLPSYRISRCQSSVTTYTAIIMPIRLFRLLLLLALAFTPVYSQAQTGWSGMLSSVLKTGQALTITDEQLAETVREAIEVMDKEYAVCSPNNKYTKRLSKLTKNMENVEGLELNFKVYQTKEVNAFACPDGSVRVYSALMDILSDDELLGVIGHEIGHVALRHSKKAWQWALLRSAASDAIGAVSETWSNLSDTVLGDIFSAAITAKHSREHESQADNYGYDFLKECGMNPWAMGKAFMKLKALSQQKNNSRIQKWLQVFSSHPDFDTRIEQMRLRAQEDGYETDDL